MSDINHAHEVLSNEDSRARYDQGEDPNDPMQNQGGGHNPFGGFHFQQAGHGHHGGFQFHFG